VLQISVIFHVTLSYVLFFHCFTNSDPLKKFLAEGSNFSSKY